MPRGDIIRRGDTRGKSWVMADETYVQVFGAGEGADKRFATLQICLSASQGANAHPPLTILFRGKGERLTRNEVSQHPPNVKILWQPKAWADRATCLAWVEQVWHPFASKLDGPKLLICDNLDGHKLRAHFKQLWLNRE
eukprot:5687616-Pyramimonas_sp.AAC.1